MVETLKSIIRKILLRFYLFQVYFHDSKRYIKYSDIKNKTDNESKLIGLIIKKYHVIEKGLTMPKMRYGFGVDKLNSLIVDCEKYGSIYNIDNVQFQAALNIISEYKITHDVNNKEIQKSLEENITNLLYKFPKTKTTGQKTLTKNEYIKDLYSSFDKFSASRHSLRNYSGTVEIEDLCKAIMLAQNAPSACNRQPARVHIIENKIKISKILAIQSGNRGFGDLIDKLLIVTSEIGSYATKKERNLIYVDGGMYSMNLLYALHYHKIGTCPLNWADTADIDKNLRSIISFPESETAILAIACGGIPDSFKVACSTRNQSNLYKIHN